MNRKLLLILMTLIVSALILAGCGDQEKKSDEPAMAYSAPTVETIKIGVFEPLTGEYSEEGKRELLGVRFANERRQTVEIGGVEYPIELEYMDNQSDKRETLTAAKELIDKGVVAVVGSYSSSLTDSASKLFEDSKIPVVTASDTVGDVTFGKPYHFRTSFLDTFQGTIMGNFAREEGLTKVALLTEANNEYFEELAKYFKGAFEANNGNIVYEAFTSDGQEDFKAIVKEMKNKKTEGVFLNVGIDSALAFAKEAKKADLDVHLYGGDSFDNEKIISKNTVGMKIVTFFDERDHSSRASTKFVKNMKEYLKEDKEAFAINNESNKVNCLTALGYDAYNIIYYGLAALENEEGIVGEKLREEIAKVSILGVTGHLSFDENGDVIKENAYIREVSKDSLKTNNLSYYRKQGVGKSYVD